VLLLLLLLLLIQCCCYTRLSPAAPVHRFPAHVISHKECASQSHMGIYDKIFVVLLL
jgi:hypothetical protein